MRTIKDRRRRQGNIVFGYLYLGMPPFWSLPLRAPEHALADIGPAPAPHRSCAT